MRATFIPLPWTRDTKQQRVSQARWAPQLRNSNALDTTNGWSRTMDSWIRSKEIVPIINEEVHKYQLILFTLSAVVCACVCVCGKEWIVAYARHTGGRARTKGGWPTNTDTKIARDRSIFSANATKSKWRFYIRNISEVRVIRDNFLHDWVDKCQRRQTSNLTYVRQR